MSGILKRTHNPGTPPKRSKGKGKPMSKKRAAKKGRKKARSPAQKAATKRMLAANKAHKHGRKKNPPKTWAEAGKPARAREKAAAKIAAHRAGQVKKAKRARAAIRAGKLARPTSAYKGYSDFLKAKREGRDFKVKRGTGKKHTHKARVASYIRRVNPFVQARNPSVSTAKDLLLGAAAGLAAGVVVPAVCNRFFPGNEMAPKVGIGIAVGGGLLLATKHPEIGAGIAAGAVAGGLAPVLATKLEAAIAKTPGQKKLAGMRMGALQFSNQMGAITARMGAVSSDMSAVTARIGKVSTGPFGQSPF